MVDDRATRNNHTAMKIHEAQLRIYGVAGRGLEKKVMRSGLGVPFGRNDEYTDEIAAALGLPTPATLAGIEVPAEVSPEPTRRPGREVTPPVTRKTAMGSGEAKAATRQASALAPAFQGHRYEWGEKIEPKKAVFENQLLFLGMLITVCLIDGVAMGVIGEEVMGGAIQVKVGMFLAGAIVAYSGIQNAYTLSQKPRKNWETNPAGGWVFVFTVYQIVLHGAAGEFFGSWNKTVSQTLLATGVPMATAALSVLLFNHQTDTK